jgi:hypothetical protein
VALGLVEGVKVVENTGGAVTIGGVVEVVAAAGVGGVVEVVAANGSGSEGQFDCISWNVSTVTKLTWRFLSSQWQINFFAQHRPSTC